MFTRLAETTSGSWAWATRLWTNTSPPGIMAIIHGNAAPEEAVSQIERGSE